jgi:hypothetical protein
MSVFAVLLGGVFLLWPAFLNGYPLVFSDTAAFLHQVAPPPSGPLAIWDKPYVYGPILLALSWRISLWPVVLAQCLMLSWLLWLTQRALCGTARPVRHLIICFGVALLTTAPFTATLLMPDVFTPAVLLSLLLLGFAPALRRAEAVMLSVIAALGIAAHLSHLPLALAMLGFVAALSGWRAAARVTLPLLAALGLLLAGNVWGHGRLSLSPYGATFLLARLQDDGPATAVIRARCPASGWYLCGAVARLPMDSDEFLWAPDSPVNQTPDGTPRYLGGATLAPEARAIVTEAIRAAPLGVAWAMLRNTARQLGLAAAGDTLGPGYLAVALRPRLVEAVGAADLAAYDRALQPQGRLPATVAALQLPHALVLLFGLSVLILVAWAARGGAVPARRGLLCGALLGFLVNAWATGALSKPHHRYEARLIWLAPVLAAFAVWPAGRRDA